MQTTIERYEHHGRMVAVQSALRGSHREHCLCYACEKMKPGSPEHCPIASELYTLVVKHGLVTPVYECPEFSPKS